MTEELDLAKILTWLRTTGWDILYTLVIAILAYWAAKILLQFTLRIIIKARAKASKINRMELRQRQDTLAELTRTILKLVVVIVALFGILQRDFGVNLAPLLASAGIIGVALGFGAQNIVKDSLAGLFVLVENQYRIGDYIAIDGAGMDRAQGKVEKISLRSTALRDLDGDLHFIPNGQITQIINRTIGFSKVNFHFKVATAENLEAVKRIINETGTHMAVDKKWQGKIKEAIHFKEMGGFDKDGYDISVSGVTEPAEQWNVTSEYRTRLLKNLKKAGIKLV